MGHIHRGYAVGDVMWGMYVHAWSGDRGAAALSCIFGDAHRYGGGKGDSAYAFWEKGS